MGTNSSQETPKAQNISSCSNIGMPNEEASAVLDVSQSSQGSEKWGENTNLCSYPDLGHSILQTRGIENANDEMRGIEVLVKRKTPIISHNPARSRYQLAKREETFGDLGSATMKDSECARRISKFFYGGWDLNYDEIEDPFKPKKQLQNSPPRHVASGGDATQSCVNNAKVLNTNCQDYSRETKLESNRSDSSPEPESQDLSINSEVNDDVSDPETAEYIENEFFEDTTTFDFELLARKGSLNEESLLSKQSLSGVKFDPPEGAVDDIDQNIPPSEPSIEEKSAGDAGADKVPPTPLRRSYTEDSKPLISFTVTLEKQVPQANNEKAEMKENEVKAPSTESNVKQVESEGNDTITEDVTFAPESVKRQEDTFLERIGCKEGLFEQVQKELEQVTEERELLKKQVAMKTQEAQQMAIIMEEYEKTISQLVAEKEYEKQKEVKLIKERDDAVEDLDNVEAAFSDVHRKYERSKSIIGGMKKNEGILKTTLAEYHVSLRKQEQKYEVLKSHAEEQLEYANEELENMRRSQQGEIAKLKAMLKKAEVRTVSLEEMLEQKERQNLELTAICDELIGKVGVTSED